MELKTLNKMNSDYLITEEEDKKLESIQNEYDNLIDQLKIKGQYDEEKFEVLIWRNIVRALPLLKFEDPKNSNEVELIKKNQLLFYGIFGLLDLALFKIISDDEGYKKLSEYNVGSFKSRLNSRLRSEFKEFAEIFFYSPDTTRKSYEIASMIVLVEKFLGKEKAEKCDRLIKYELGISDKKEFFCKEDYGEDFDAWFECLENNGFGYFADYVKEFFDSDFILNDLDTDALRKRVIIFLAINYSKRFLSGTPLAEVVSIITLSKSLNFTADEAGKLIKYVRKNKWSLAVIQEQMKFFKEDGMSIDAYIRGGDLSFVSHKITQIFKILFPNLIEEPCVSSRGKGDYRILTTPKELLNSLEIYNPQTNKIVHFTSLFKLKKILETNTFRLYNAHNSNDKTEFANWLDDFDIDADKLKQKTYIGSFCDSKILDDNEKASVMWNEYGEQGKGVVIKFEIAKDINTKIFEDNF